MQKIKLNIYDKRILIHLSTAYFLILNFRNFELFKLIKKKNQLN